MRHMFTPLFYHLRHSGGVTYVSHHLHYFFVIARSTASAGRRSNLTRSVIPREPRDLSCQGDCPPKADLPLARLLRLRRIAMTP